MSTLLVHGSLDATAADSNLEARLPQGLLVKPKFSGQPGLARNEVAPHSLQVDDTDVVELDLGEGLRIWTSVERLREDAANLSPRSAPDGESFVLPPQLSIGAPSRGTGEWIIKGLKIFDVDVAGNIADFVADKVEGQLQPGPGLYRCSPAAAGSLQLLAAGLDASQPNVPVLVFLHGTASTHDGSFGGLWDGGAKSRIAPLFDAYQGQVFAFHHRTLTQSPIENALTLARQLPKGTRVHLVSHSRGGMVGELLCRTMAEGRFAFDESDRKRFQGASRERDLAALDQLAAELAQRQLQVERLVRVACPARGTTLAGGRLDRYLSLLVNLLGLTGLKASPVYDAVSSLLLAVIKKRTDPRELPGLEAMMPGSPLVALLNRPDFRTRAELFVLGGDIEGVGAVSRLKVLATDLFYREDHDLVVNTPAMFGGAPRVPPIRYWIDQGANVDHFRYFRNPDTAERLVAALLEPDRASFHVLEHKPNEVTEDDYRKRAVEPQPVVFVLPGIMGSHLMVNQDRVWLDYFDLALGGLERLRIEAAKVTPEKPIGDGYAELIRFLASSHEVVPFAYDWRDTLQTAASRLRTAIEERLPSAEQAHQPIRILAHSMGGLVVRMMLASDEGRQTWNRVCSHPGARLVMLGTPNRGSHSIAAMLIGRDALVRKLALLDMQHDYAGLLQIISRFPGVMDLLPDSGSLDLFDPASWKRVRDNDVGTGRGLGAASAASVESSGVPWPLPPDDLLAQARATRKQIEKVALDPNRVLYVAGCAPSTPVDMTVDPSAVAGRRVLVQATEHGDGRVPWSTGIPPELSGRVWYMDAVHGDMAATPDAFPALLDLLNAGTTTKLPQTPPARRSAISERFVAVDEPPAMYPDEADLTAAALGGSGRKRKRMTSRRVRVRIVHGDLAHARSPVAVGHYRGDTIVSAEAYLDRVLGGRLRQRQRLGLYPGALDTAEVFLTETADRRSSNEHPGAIVLGLGDVGELAPGTLASGFARAAVMYAAARFELARQRDGTGNQPATRNARISTSLTTLLIGTGAGGFGVADSVQSLLRGALRANERLQLLAAPEIVDTQGAKRDNRSDEARGPDTISIDELEIVELYEDRAIQAVKAMLDLGRSAEFRERLVIEEFLATSEGGRRRAYFQEDAAWWQRLRIESTKDGALKFDALTERARAETFLQPMQRKLVEAFLDRAVATTATDPELCFTLFDLLLPNRLKEHAPDRRNLVLIVDERSAAYPWELLHNRFDAGSRPMAVEAGVLRQLAVREFRERVASALEANALVVGDPKNSDPRFVPLPGAQEEARAVAQQLRSSDYQVTSLIGNEATPTAVLQALHARPYRVLHLAAHGVFEFELPDDDGVPGAGNDPCRRRKTITGMALGDGLFLTPAEIEQMRLVPDLVFINCCHLGTTKGESPVDSVKYHRLAANVAVQLIRMGVRAVIAAGWAVDDAAAKSFANRFYAGFLNGRPFGDAVRDARQEIHASHGHTNTWGAYQCYGDPDFVIDPTRSRDSPWSATPCVAAAELRLEAENLAQQIRTASDKELEGLKQRLERMLKTMPSEWWRSSANCAAVGQAYGELGLFEKAIEYYERATSLESADARLKVVEQLANLRAKFAQRLVESDPKRSRELFEAAEGEIDHVIAIGATPERLSIKGSLNKRRARGATSARARIDALRKMAEGYLAAKRLASDPGNPNFRSDESYPLQNWLVAAIGVAWHDAPETALPADIEQGLKRLSDLAETLPSEKPDFWTLCLESDAQLLRHLASRAFGPAAVDAIVQGYKAAARRSGSPREIESIVAHVEFIEAMVQHFAPGPKRKAMASDLKGIVEALRGG